MGSSPDDLYNVKIQHTLNWNQKFWGNDEKKTFMKNSFFETQKMCYNGIFSHFNNKFKEVLDHYWSIKTASLKGNTKPHIKKTPKKQIMKNSQLKNQTQITG